MSPHTQHGTLMAAFGMALLPVSHGNEAHESHARTPLFSWRMGLLFRTKKKRGVRVSERE